MALATVAFQLLTTDVDIIQFLSLSFEGPAKWFFIGILLYLILIVAIAVTAVFYNHLEINLKRKFSKVSNILAWIHLFGMNIGGAGTTILMIFAGLAGSGVLSLFLEGKLGNQDVAIMTSFSPSIAFFILILSVGVIWRYAYLIVYRIESITLLTLQFFVVTSLSKSPKHRRYNISVCVYMTQIYFQLSLLCHMQMKSDGTLFTHSSASPIEFGSGIMERSLR